MLWKLYSRALINSKAGSIFFYNLVPWLFERTKHWSIGFTNWFVSSCNKNNTLNELIILVLRDNFRQFYSTRRIYIGALERINTHWNWDIYYFFHLFLEIEAIMSLYVFFFSKKHGWIVWLSDSCVVSFIRNRCKSAANVMFSLYCLKRRFPWLDAFTHDTRDFRIFRHLVRSDYTRLYAIINFCYELEKRKTKLARCF